MVPAAGVSKECLGWAWKRAATGGRRMAGGEVAGGHRRWRGERQAEEEAVDGE